MRFIFWFLELWNMGSFLMSRWSYQDWKLFDDGSSWRCFDVCWQNICHGFEKPSSWSQKYPVLLCRYTIFFCYCEKPKCQHIDFLGSKGKDVFVWWIPFLIILNVLAFIGTVDWFISIFFPQLYKKKEDVTEE